MTVKINDELLFGMYENAVQGMDINEPAPLLCAGWFWNNFSEYQPDWEAEKIEEAKTIFNAIIDGKDIELVEPKFRIRILRMNSNSGHQYVTSNINSAKRFACGEINSYVLCGTAIQKFTRSDFSNEEWEYFKGNPEVFKFEEVKDA